jgi:hypothetical protein
MAGSDAAPAGRLRRPALGRPRDPIGGHYDPSARSSLDWNRSTCFGRAKVRQADEANWHQSLEKKPGRKPGNADLGIRNRRRGAPRGARILQKRMRQDGRLVRHSVLHPLACRGARKRPLNAGQGLRPTRGRQEYGRFSTTAFPSPHGRGKQESRKEYRYWAHFRVALPTAFWLYPRAFPVGVKRPQSGHPRRSCAGGSVFPACHINRS